MTECARGGVIDYGQHQYGAYGRPQTTTSPYAAVTNYTYDANNVTLISATTGTRIVKTTLDDLARTIKVETGDASAVQSVVEAEYDSCACSPLGKVKRVSQPYAPGGTPVWTTYTYDALGRTTRIDLPGGGAMAYVYYGKTITVTDPAGKWKTYAMDSLGKLVQVTNRRRKAARTRPTTPQTIQPVGAGPDDAHHQWCSGNPDPHLQLRPRHGTSQQPQSINGKQQKMLPDLIQTVSLGAGAGLIVGALFDRSISSPWRVVAADACVGIAAALGAAFFSVSEWTRMFAARRSVIDQGFFDRAVVFITMQQAIFSACIAVGVSCAWRVMKPRLHAMGLSHRSQGRS